MTLLEWEFLSQGYKVINDGIFVLGETLTEPKITIWLEGYGKNVWVREYSIDLRLSRDHAKGPAQEEFNSDGQTIYAGYYLDGLPHRPIAEGPAKIWYTDDGETIKEEYWEHGRRKD